MTTIYYNIKNRTSNQALDTFDEKTHSLTRDGVQSDYKVTFLTFIFGLDYINLQGKNILMRADLNVPIKEGKIIDKTRIYSILPTIKKILKNSGKIILITHFGRPKGKIQHDLSVQFLQKPLEEICKSPVFFSHQNTGEEKNAKIKSLKEGEILLLENLRFNPLEELNKDTK